ncbi:MAG: hypothetical protein JWL75_481 [Parcubacteria group bacterium]|nr:hypothetical protein [Parcubacteria group bacterium]
MTTGIPLSHSLGAAITCDITIITLVSLYVLIRHRRHHFRSTLGTVHFLHVMSVLVFVVIGLYAFAHFLLWLSSVAEFLLLPFAVLYHT